MDIEHTPGQTTKRFPTKLELMGLSSDQTKVPLTRVKTRGLFIVFEGGEGCGKTTQASLLSEALGVRGVVNVLTREPGDTHLGQDLRRILIDPHRSLLTKKAEALLFAADRAEHVERMINPALERGETVICDRYRDSTMAYQAYGGGLEWQQIDRISEWASDGLVPDVTYFLDVDPAVGLERARQNKPNRFEGKDLEYHNRVRNGFLAMRNHTYVRINGEYAVDVIHQIILNHTINFLWERSNPAMPSVEKRPR